MSFLRVFYQIPNSEKLTRQKYKKMAADEDDKLQKAYAAGESIRRNDAVLYAPSATGSELQFILQQLKLSSKQALLISTENGRERAAWHDWAEKNGYKEHISIKTAYYHDVYIHYCESCKHSWYNGEIDWYEGDDYFVCPDYECRNTIDKPAAEAANAIYISNGRPKRIPRGAHHHKSRYSNEEEPVFPKLTLDDIPKRVFMIIDIEDLQ